MFSSEIGMPDRRRAHARGIATREGPEEDPPPPPTRGGNRWAADSVYSNRAGPRWTLLPAGLPQRGAGGGGRAGSRESSSSVERSRGTTAPSSIPAPLFENLQLIDSAIGL